MDYLYRTKPYQHQHDAFMSDREKKFYGYFWEMGAGKSKIIIDTAAWLYSRGLIKGLLVVVYPNGGHRNWVEDQVPTHLPDYIPCTSAYWTSTPRKHEREALEFLGSTKAEGLRVLAMNVEAFATKKGAQFAQQFLLSFPSLFVIDESTSIKNPDAIRTDVLLKLKRLAPFRRVLTGTPVTQSPLDLYTQMSFLDENILRTSSFYAFRNRYAVLEDMENHRTGKTFKVISGYQNIEELNRLIAPYTSRILKEDCLDLPEKIYVKRYVELSAEQTRLYTELKKFCFTIKDGHMMSAPLAITKLLRFQQIVGGFIVPDEQVALKQSSPIDKVNPRVKLLTEICDEASGKVIVFARFRAEIDAISRALREKFGPFSVVEYHGGIDGDSRREAITSFQDKDSPVNFFIGSSSASMVITLTAATTVVYYSNSFNLAERLQSEDRAHRIGQHHPVTYVDIVAKDTVDEKIVKALREKVDIARVITGDNWKEWI